MWKILWRGTLAATFLYWIAGVFGYVTFIERPNELNKVMKNQDILEGEYFNNIAIYIARFGLLLVIMVATPLSLLPCKDTVEELTLGTTRTFTKKENFLVTFVLVIISYLLAIVIPSIGDAITILGATTNPCIGFIFPVIFYLKME